MNDPVAWVAGAGVVGLGAAIWFGAWRSWADPEAPNRYWMLAVPWMGLGFIVALSAWLVRQVGIPLPPWVGQALLVGCCAAMLSVMTVGRPRWGVPGWLRELEAAGRAARDGPDRVRSPRRGTR
jgi:hypothetical protein